jgi:hypothetical protein
MSALGHKQTSQVRSGPAAHRRQGKRYRDKVRKIMAGRHGR